MSNSNFIRGDEKNLRAPEVLGEELGSFFTRDQEETAARKWEIKHNRPLQRSWENEEAFKKRKALFRRDPTRKAKRLHMDPGRAADELVRYERTYKGKQLSGRPEDKEADKVLKMTFQHMNDLRAAAGLEDVDYTAQEDKTLPDEVLERFDKFERYPQWQDREAYVASCSDRELLRVIAVHDVDERVQRAAEERLAVLSIEV